MKKIILFAVITLSVATLIGCSNKGNSSTVKETLGTENNTDSSESSKNNTKDNAKTESSNSSKNNISDSKKVSENIKIPSRKQEFKGKLDKIQEKLDIEGKSAESGSNNDMKQFAYKSYNEWDKSLNEIYSVLKQQLSADDMKKLNIEETKWISEKENKAKKDSEQMQGGSGESLLYESSLSESTKERCYFLINNYLK